MELLPEFEYRQVGLFILVGLANTLIDFAIYNLLTGRPLRWPRVRANLVSTTLAMAFSFFVNLWLVFPAERLSLFDRALKFVGVTACSLYLVQSGVIYFFTNIAQAPIAMTVSTVRKMTVFRNWSEDVIGRNLVKILATGFSLVWNFLWYKFYVFT